MFRVEMAFRTSNRRSVGIAVGLASFAPMAVALCAVGWCGCGGDAPPPPKTASAEHDAAEGDRISKSQRKIAEADRAYDAKKFDKARKLLREASAIGVESHRYDISQSLEKVDKRQAKLFASEAQEKLQAKDCSAAFKELAEPIAELDSEAFTREVRRLIQADAVKCVQAAVDEATMAGNYAAARALVNAAETKAVLGPAQKKAAQELDGTIAEALKAKLDGDLKAKKWADAIAKLDATVKKGDADESQAQLILQAIRAAMAPEVAAAAQKGVGQRDAPATLRQVDALIKLGRWEILPPESAALAKETALPEDLAKRREVLAIWVEGQRLGLKPNRTAEKRWTHGKLSLAPASKVDGETRRDIGPSTEVWVLGQTKDRALVADAAAEGTLPQLLEKAVGWVPLDRLAKEATEEWVPPDEQLVGARVWAPLRAPDPLLELGTVSEVKGKDILVKRVADDKVITVPRKGLRNGRLAKGTKVVGPCKTKDEVATVEEVTAGPRPAVKVKCGDELKEEFLPALRTRPDLLPATKQP